MIPTTLTADQAKELIRLGRARRQGAECLTTARARYEWNAQTQVYERQDEPHPLASDVADVQRTCQRLVNRTELVLYRLGYVLQCVGLFIILGAFVWWAKAFYGSPEGSYGPCLYSFTPACDLLQIVAMMRGIWPYNPLVFWFGVMVGGAGTVLSFWTAPHSRLADWLCSRPVADDAPNDGVRTSRRLS